MKRRPFFTCLALCLVTVHFAAGAFALPFGQKPPKPPPPPRPPQPAGNFALLQQRAKTSAQQHLLSTQAAAARHHLLLQAAAASQHHLLLSVYGNFAKQHLLEQTRRIAADCADDRNAPVTRIRRD
jgi:hypothetical protein